VYSCKCIKTSFGQFSEDQQTGLKQFDSIQLMLVVIGILNMFKKLYLTLI
jgi:hypothetical protein